MSEKDKIAAYRQFCREQEQLPIFLQDWWLDEVCAAGRWQVAICRDAEGKLEAALPYFIHRRWKLPAIVQPPLTPCVGPIFREDLSHLKLHKQYSKRDLAIASLLDQLPGMVYCELPLIPGGQDWMAFHRAGFEQQRAYTYVLEDASDLNVVFSGFASNVRNYIRRAREQLTVCEHEDIALLHQLLTQTFERQNLRSPLSLDLLQRLDRAARQRGQCRFLIVKNAQEQVHAGVFLVWDRQKMYNLMLGADTQLRAGGAVQLLLWKAIQLASELGLAFDFEGSMLPSVETMFRGFGGRRVGYHRLYRYGNRFWKLLHAMR
ncbi:MAG: GNAT family N-acetyltransferase [Bacteroidota bacterium]